ncbi:nuclear transport factor 2 family protein [Pedobacter chinensis]|uniref:Nuclear transport factor 2 family protein n=1 Tax=Pedobacter chinensis TaxID=2282421 RepID=A0A369PWX6_9SPHI|nr:nuclear transport factor 2 family protein [Pedobacter chinensis]RDC55189.1 nuclear transport factor 2 family protein [Pedobacter chinensis]
MSAQRKELLIKANEAISTGDHEGFLEFCTEDTVWEFIGDKVLEGKQSVREYMAENYHEPPKFNVIDLIAEGDLLTAVGEISIKDKNGTVLHYDYCDVWRFAGDKLAGLRAFVVAKQK